MPSLPKIFIQELLKKNRISDSLQLMKFYPAWKASLDRNFNHIEARTPWITYEAIEILNDFIKPGYTIFEFGSGGSTLFFLDKGAILTTVEHDKDWYKILRREVAKEAAVSWHAILAEPLTNPSPEKDNAEDPDHFVSGSSDYTGMSFINYACSIDQYDNRYFDVVLIDGRSRPACIKRSLEKIKVGGLLVLDNSERSYYTKQLQGLNQFRILLDKFGPIPGLKWFTKTTVWQRVDEYETF